MGLFSKKSAIQKKIQKQNVNSFGERLDRLDADGEIPWGWHAKNAEVIGRYESKIYAVSTTLDKMTVLEKKAALKKMIAVYYDFKDFCYKKDECFKKYFSDMWEHCHNTKDPDFIFITRYEEELKHIEENTDSLLQLEKRTKEIEATVLPHLRQDLIRAIDQAPGIIQADLYKQFENDVKQYIQSELYFMEKDGIITREKTGRTYKLYKKNDMKN